MQLSGYLARATLRSASKAGCAMTAVRSVHAVRGCPSVGGLSPLGAGGLTPFLLPFSLGSPPLPPLPRSRSRSRSWSRSLSRPGPRPRCLAGLLRLCERVLHRCELVALLALLDGHLQPRLHAVAAPKAVGVLVVHREGAGRPLCELVWRELRRAGRRRVPLVDRVQA